MSWEKDLNDINRHLEWAKDYISDVEDHVKEELAEAQHEITELTDTITEYEKEIERLDGVIIEYIQEVSELNSKVATLEFDLIEVVGELEILKVKYTDLQLKIDFE